MGDHDCHLGNWGLVDFDVFVEKELNYKMIMMSTYSGLMVHYDQKEEYKFSKGQVLMFNYA